MKTFTVDCDDNLKNFTDRIYPQGSFCLSRLLKDRDVKVNGVRVNKNVPVRAGDEVVYYTAEKQERALSHNVVYEDANVYIADKYSGVDSAGLLNELKGKGEFYAVHRLDRNTCGLIIFAKTREAEKELISAFKERRVEKIYLAQCKDCFKEDEKTLFAYLEKDEKNSTVKIYGKERPSAVKIITEYKVLSRSGGVALVEITLHTGKTHQIRAHMAYIGCPVVGDEKYGDRTLNAALCAKRQRLIAKKLKFDFSGGLSYLNGKVFESSLEF